jgi:hypothetical protein
MKPPPLLLEAFRSTELLESIGALLDGDGFDAEVCRILAVWPNVGHEWKQPERPCPDDGIPTAAAWRWIWSGSQTDIAELAEAANVSRSTAREKLTMLIAARCVYPDGGISKGARGAIQALIASRLPKKRKPKREDDAAN